jgi:uncharacterized protein
MRLAVVEGEFGVARLAANDPAPEWAHGSITCLTRTADELSIVCAAGAIPVAVRAERGWRCLRVVGTLDFSLTGVLSSIVGPLAAANISVFALSTYDTDYLLVRGQRLAAAIDALRAAGHEVLEP